MPLTHLPTTWDPGIRPDRSGLPPGLTNFLTNIGGGVYWAAIVILGVLFIISVIGWVAGKTGAVTQRMQTASMAGVIISVLGIFLLAAGPGLLSFFGNAGSQV